MRKWFYFFLIIAAAYVASQLGKKGKQRSSLFKNISETVSIIVWILIAVYTVGFIYWLYTELIK